MPAAEKRTEGDWVQLGQDEELFGARLKALEDYKLALQEFPGSILLLKAAGRLSVDLLHYANAVAYLEPVAARQTWDAETAYYLAIAYDGLGRERDSRISFQQARLAPEFHAAASLELGELEARQGQLKLAAIDLREAVRTAPDDPRCAEELVAVLKALGQTAEAEELAKQALKQDPVSYIFARSRGRGIMPTSVRMLTGF